MRRLKNLYNQWKSIGPALVSQIFFKCLIFDCYISFCKKERSKMRHLNKIGETNGGKIKEQDGPIDLRFPTGMIQIIYYF